MQRSGEKRQQWTTTMGETCENESEINEKRDAIDCYNGRTVDVHRAYSSFTIYNRNTEVKPE